VCVCVCVCMWNILCFLFVSLHLLHLNLIANSSCCQSKQSVKHHEINAKILHVKKHACTVRDRHDNTYYLKKHFFWGKTWYSLNTCIHIQKCVNVYVIRVFFYFWSESSNFWDSFVFLVPSHLWWLSWKKYQLFLFSGCATLVMQTIFATRFCLKNCKAEKNTTHRITCITSQEHIDMYCFISFYVKLARAEIIIDFIFF
jgi:hypothetical protein